MIYFYKGKKKIISTQVDHQGLAPRLYPHPSNTHHINNPQETLTLTRKFVNAGGKVDDAKLDDATKPR